MKTTDKTMKALLVMLFVSFTTIGADLKVYPNAMAPDFDNIQGALDAAVDGDKIYIDTVTFVGNIDISKSVALYPLHKGGMFTVNGSTTLSFDNFRNIELHGMNGAGISDNGYINDSASVLINGCYFTSSVFLNQPKLLSYIYYSSFNSTLHTKRTELIGNTFNGTVVWGKMIKLLKGKTGIIFGNSLFFILSFNKFLKIYILIKNFIIDWTKKTIYL